MNLHHIKADNKIIYPPPKKKKNQTNPMVSNYNGNLFEMLFHT